MRKLISLPENSAFFGTLPDGCTYCGPGQKLVLLITGKCSRRCFYCPLSFAKRGKEVIFANELKVNSLEQIIQEARNISAKGTGITGGDPMMVPQLTLEVIRLLKSKFGNSHHIHLYTTGDFKPEYLEELTSAGLDEIRFHPSINTWAHLNKRFDNLLKTAVRSELLIGAELPVIPGYGEIIKRFARKIDSRGVVFLNLNELEYSESNWQKFDEKAFTQKSDISNAVKGSEELALHVLHDLASENSLKINIHYCSAQFKDRQQLSNRIKRRAKNVIQPHQLLTDDGTFFFSIILPDQNIGSKEKESEELKRIYLKLKKHYKVPTKLIKFDYDKNRIEIAPWVIKELKTKLPNTIRTRSFMIEEYPTADHLEVERIPIDEFL